jgi:FtsP/CotA-like multicopper oxidase with cupredoxin domain
MREAIGRAIRGALLLAGLGLAASSANGQAVVAGIQGSDFSLTAGPAYIDTPDGDSLLIWAYGNGAGSVQYPGPTLIVNQGDLVEITLTNNLGQNASIVFPGQGEVSTDPLDSGAPGVLTREAVPGGTVTYRFTAGQPGTYLYHSGTSPELQVEMGMLGALIVRPAGFDQDDPAQRTAYGHPDTAYDHEYLLVLSEMDPLFHDLVDFGFAEFVDNPSAFPVFWFINGRNGMDTLAADNVGWKPHQPYGSLVRARPGERVLLRLIGAGRDQHAFHPHGAHSLVIARDGRMVSSGAPNAGPDLAVADFTITPDPGSTVDAIFQWTGAKLNWDIYGHGAGGPDLCNGAAGPSPGFDPVTREYCPDHTKPMPVVLPGLQDLTFGGWYSGSPFLGQFGELPPEEGGLNLNAGLFFMWHSHNEKELTNFDVFPGGMLTFLVIEPPGVPIP